MVVEAMRSREWPADQLERLFAGGWPAFIGADAEADRHLSRVRDLFGDYELALTDGGDLVAAGWAVPLAWSGDPGELPAGYTDSLGRALADHDRAAPTGTLVVCAVQVRADRRGRGLAARLLRGFVDLADRTGHHRVVAPLRPIRKSAYPLTPIEQYASWVDGDGRSFDPWVRTHERMGARVVATAPRSQTMMGTVRQWEGWTGLALPASGPYVIPDGLSPLEVDVERDVGVYVEPNIWVRHR